MNITRPWFGVPPKLGFWLNFRDAVTVSEYRWRKVPTFLHRPGRRYHLPEARWAKWRRIVPSAVRSTEGKRRSERVAMMFVAIWVPLSGTVLGVSSLIEWRGISGTYVMSAVLLVGIASTIPGFLLAFRGRWTALVLLAFGEVLMTSAVAVVSDESSESMEKGPATVDVFASMALASLLLVVLPIVFCAVIGSLARLARRPAAR
ncbi:hypothetical protein HUT16_00105 [Kitasatospora sp. NA04385]|uniref:hypothetical protein n=1 Tax=Kitasatospora sp. NA04385 TaxID=2742135 RepID=UPI0015903620|nr:hypothetical protein [Kitasatospora sp. NA04385]QKW17678.1 hypothetical protein HUT16_00105 [Kitasatospora sp. NA04385]